MEFKNHEIEFLEAVVQCQTNGQPGCTRKSVSRVVSVMKAAWQESLTRGAFLDCLKKYQYGGLRGAAALLQFINESEFGARR
jgi:hypothetical protein